MNINCINKTKENLKSLAQMQVLPYAWLKLAIA